MRGQCCCLEVWEDLSYLCQLFLCEGSSKFVFVGDVRSDVFLGTEFSCLVACDELGVELGSEDMLRRSEVVGVDGIRHRSVRNVRDDRCGGVRNDRVLAHCAPPYISVEGGS